MNNTRYLELDFYRTSYRSVKAHQYDKNTRFIEITCINDATVYPLNPASMSCDFKLKTPDGRHMLKPQTIRSDGKVLIMLEESMLLAAGICKAELNVYEIDSKKLLSTMPFDLVVIGSVYDNKVIESSDEFDRVTSIIFENKELGDSLRQLEKDISDAENVRDSAENQRNANEQIRQSNEQTRINEENKRVSAENIRIDTESERNSAESVRVSNEDIRIANENERKVAETTRGENETVRESNEDVRKDNENARKTNESARLTEEEKRIEAENIRKANEDVRISNEDARNTAENERNDAENIRASSEDIRIENENIRVANENSRKENESAREDAEADRDEKENIRQTNESTRQTDEDVRKASEIARNTAEIEREESENSRITNENVRNENETVREENESVRIIAENNRITAEDTRIVNENERNDSETARTNAENQRNVSENARIKAESERDDAESIRIADEAQRSASEDVRVKAELMRNDAETSRSLSEADRDDAETVRRAAENTRVLNETKRQNNETARETAETERANTFTELQSNINTELGKLGNANVEAVSGTSSFQVKVTDRDGNVSASPNLLNSISIGTVETGDPDEDPTASITGGFGNQKLNLRLPTGKPFKISDTYSSIAAMNDDIENIKLYDFIMINTGSVEDEDTGKLYMKDVNGMFYLTDLSGVQGIQGVKGDTGATPLLTIGTVTTAEPGTQASATISGTAENPVINLVIPKGDTGTIEGANGANIPYAGDNDTNKIKDVVDGKLGKTENAVSATKAEQDSRGQKIDETYIKDLSVSGKVITFTRGDDTTDTLTTQDTNSITGVKGNAENEFRKGNVNITPENIGLGNVPNVSTNDQAPTFEQAATRANINSGEKLSVLFSKIKKIIADLKSVAFTGSYGDLSDKPISMKNPAALSFTGGATGSYDGSVAKSVAIPTVGNGTVTIKQAGASKGSFTMNQSGNTTIELTDSNTTYPLTATSNTAVNAPSTAAAIVYANGLPTSVFGGSIVDSALFSQRYSDLWQTFLYQDYRTGHLAVKGKNNGTETAIHNIPWAKTPQSGTGTTKYLRDDGTWQVPPNTTYTNATTSAAGLMSASDKNKLDGIASGAQVNTVSGVKGNAESSYRTGQINITPANIGLGNVNNTSDANKPISTAQQNALNGKVNKTGDTMSGTLNNSLSTNTYLEGNKGKALINSTAAAGGYVMLAKMNSTNGYFTQGIYQTKYLLQYTAKTVVDANTNNVSKSVTLLDESGNSVFPGTVTANTFSGSLSGKATSAGSADVATKLASSAGSATQPVYFSDGKPVACTYTLGKSVPSNAVFTDTVYTHPTTAGNKHIPAGGSSGQILRWSASGTAVWGADNNTTYGNMKGATASAAGTAGLVPAPAAGHQSKFLRGDGTWSDGPVGPVGATGATGVSVSSITQTTTSTADGGTNVITVTLSNGNKSTFNIKNGSKGSTGATGATGPQGPAGVNATTTAIATSSRDGLMSKSYIASDGFLSSCLHVGGNSLAYIYNESYDINFRVGYGSGTRYTSVGAIWSHLSTSSSRKYKENIKKMTEDIANKILDVEIVTFDYKDGVIEEKWEKQYGRTGVIAEEVESLFPEVINYVTDENGNKVADSVFYTHFIPYLMKKIQMQQKEIDILKSEISKN